MIQISRYYFYLMGIVVCSLLTSCSVFSPVKTETPNIYVLNQIPAAKKIKANDLDGHSKLFIQPSSEGVYNTTRMIYSTQPYEINYFAKNSWADMPAQMLASGLLQALEQTHSFRVVNLAPASGSYDYVLAIRLIELKQLFFKQSSEISMIVDIALTRTKDGKIIINREIRITEPALTNTPYAGVVAANKAMSKILEQILLSLSKNKF